MRCRCKKAALTLLLFLLTPAAGLAVAFEQVSDHCFFLALGAERANVGAIVTSQGILLIDPPAEAELPPVLEALREISTSPVRWIVYSSFHRAIEGGYRPLMKEGAKLVVPIEMDGLLFSGISVGPHSVIPALGFPLAFKVRPFAAESSSARLVFEGEIRLFPENLEIRIISVAARATTAADVVVMVPAERVIQTGELYLPGSFPQIDTEGQGRGDALGWIEAMRLMIAEMPVLRSAMPEPKFNLEGPPEPEKTPEEMISVVGGRGALSDLKEMKSLVDAAQRLRSQLTRAVRAKRSIGSLLESAALREYGGLGNLESYATLLYEALASSGNQAPTP